MPVSPPTQEAYLACVRQWAEYFQTAPDLITAEQLRQYFIHRNPLRPGTGKQRHHAKALWLRSSV